MQKYNMFIAQIGCAAMGVVAFSIFGPGWVARSSALAASIAFMIYTRSTHPPGTLYIYSLFTRLLKICFSNFWLVIKRNCIFQKLMGSNRSKL